MIGNGGTKGTGDEFTGVESSGRSLGVGIVNCFGRFTGVTLCFGGGRGAAAWCGVAGSGLKEESRGCELLIPAGDGTGEELASGEGMLCRLGE